MTDREHGLPAHIERHIDKSGGCWNWTGAISPTGYGRAWLAHREYIAHRLVYWLTVGGPLPQILHHECRNTRCVNPDHLAAETTRTHWRHHNHEPHGYWDRMRARTHCAAGHEFTPENTYWRPDGEGKVCRTCRREKHTAYKQRKVAA